MSGVKSPQSLLLTPHLTLLELILLHRFFVWPENIAEQLVRIDREQARHIEKVLRLVAGDIVQVFDGQGHEYEICLQGKEDGFLLGEILQELHREVESPLHLSLVQGIAKGDKMDSIIQKAVEIGVEDIYPLFSQYAVVKLEKERAGKKVERWQTIAREACKQCRRNRVPTVHAPCTFGEMMDMVAGNPTILLYEHEDNNGLKQVLNDNRAELQAGAQLFVMIGPEGGFSPDEIALAREQGVLIAGLGPRILRTETAGLVAASIILYELADLG